MIRITDITLTTLDLYNADPKLLDALYLALQRCGVDRIEMSSSVFRALAPLQADKGICLRIENPPEHLDYPKISSFVCRYSGYDTPQSMTADIQINDVQEISSLRRYGRRERFRITGLDDIMLYDYQALFGALRKNAGGNVELCPQNRYYCATAIAVEWVMTGGAEIAASFTGSGGFAATEEVLLALRIVRRHKPNLDLSVLPEIKKIYEKIIGKPLSPNKSIVGSSIFDMEAGIHVDGIAKSAKMYEPFEPEIVGMKRRLIIGKHSGRTSVLMKCRDMGLNLREGGEAALLSAVQEYSIRKGASLTDEEFIRVFHGLMEEPV